jgi:hypothetical protein
MWALANGRPLRVLFIVMVLLYTWFLDIRE